MSTLKVDTISTLDGAKTVPSDTVVNGTAKAWVNFNGTGTVAIRVAFNVSSITDNGVADYTVNFATAMPDANYALASSSGPLSNTPEFFGIRDAAPTACRVASGGVINLYFASDKANIGLAFFR